MAVTLIEAAAGRVEGFDLKELRLPDLDEDDSVTVYDLTHLQESSV